MLARSFLVSLHSLLALSACQSSTVEFETAIVDVQIVDTQTGQITPEQAILIENGVIVGIEPARDLRLQGQHEVIDGEGRYVTPGLWDSHVHALGDVDEALDRSLPLYIAFGVTHVRDMGSNLDRLVQVRQALATQSEYIAPTILASGPLMMQMEQPWYGDIQRAIGQPGQPQQAVQELSVAGVNFVKAYTGLSRTSYLELVAAAQDANLPVDGHVPDSMGLTGVISAGQRTVEHLDMSAFISCAGGADGPYGGFIAVFFTQGAAAYYELSSAFWQDVDWSECGPALETLSARGGALTPTLSMELRERARISDEARALVSPQSRSWCDQGLEAIDQVTEDQLSGHREGLLSAFAEIRARKIAILAGSDAPNHCLAHGISLSGELSRMAEAGMPLLAVLQAATLTPSRVFGVEGGRIVIGAPADLILMDRNPLNDVQAYGAVSGVYTQARWFDSQTLQRIRVNASDS